MSNELSNEISPEIINSLILNGDMSKLTAGQQTQYYNGVCQSLGINPLTQPFAVIVLNGKKILYAKKDCTQQLSNNRKINTEVKNQRAVDSVYVVDCRATMPDGRFTDDIGVVAIVGLKGLELANAMMKAVTKAKRRAVLALCGLGMPDETEVDDEQVAMMRTTTGQPGQSRVEALVENQVQEAEVISEPKKEEAKPKAEEKQPKEHKKSTNKDVAKSEVKQTDGQSVSQELPAGHLLAQGIITDPPTYAEIGAEKKPKWVFKMVSGDKELKLGTFDKTVLEGICAVMDLQNQDANKTPILINIEYKERQSGEKTLRDIIKYSQATQVPI